MSQPNRRSDASQATVSTVAAQKAGAAQLACARESRLCVSTMSSTGAEKATRKECANGAPGRQASVRHRSAANRIGPKTPNCEPRNASASAGWKSEPDQSALAAVCAKVAQPCAKFQ